MARLSERAGSTELGPPCRAADESVAYDGPRGAVRMQGNHLAQQIYLACAEGLEFDVLCRITAGA